MAGQSKDGPLRGWRALEVLQAHHLPRMKREFQLVLVRRCSNQLVEVIAEREGISISLAKQRLDRATGEVFDSAPEDLHRGEHALGVWVAFHLFCCLKEALAVLRAEAA